MSDLIVVGFPKAEEAEQVRLELASIQQEHLISLEDAVVLEHGEDGHVHLRQAINMAAAGAASSLASTLAEETPPPDGQLLLGS